MTEQPPLLSGFKLNNLASTLHPLQANVVETSAVGRHAYFRARKLQRLGECF